MKAEKKRSQGPSPVTFKRYKFYNSGGVPNNSCCDLDTLQTQLKRRGALGRHGTWDQNYTCRQAVIHNHRPLPLDWHSIKRTNFVLKTRDH